MMAVTLVIIRPANYQTGPMQSDYAKPFVVLDKDATQQCWLLCEAGHTCVSVYSSRWHLANRTLIGQLSHYLTPIG